MLHLAFYKFVLTIGQYKAFVLESILAAKTLVSCRISFLPHFI